MHYLSSQFILQQQCTLCSTNYFSEEGSSNSSICQPSLVNVNITINGAPSTINKSQLFQAAEPCQQTWLCRATRMSLWCQRQSQSNCTVYPVGNYCPLGSITPQNCSSGTYNPSTNCTGPSNCLMCPPWVQLAHQAGIHLSLLGLPLRELLPGQHHHPCPVHCWNLHLEKQQPCPAISQLLPGYPR